VPDNVEHMTEAAEPGSRRIQDDHHGVNGEQLPVPIDAGADAAGGEVAPIMPEQPVDDARSAADAAEVRQLLTVGSSFAPCRSFCSPGYTRTAEGSNWVLMKIVKRHALHFV
jgi:hypothetical protein